MKTKKELLFKVKKQLEKQLFNLTTNKEGESLSRIMLKIELGINPTFAKEFEFLQDEIFDMERRINRL